MSGLIRRRVFLRESELRKRYDVVVIGGGGHGLSTAYYLAARHGVTDVAVLERSYIGAGNTGRNTTVVRANYKAPESLPFYRAGVEMYRTLAQELDFNLLFSRRGQLWMAHSEASLQGERERVELNRAFGVETELLDVAQIREVCPILDLTGGGRLPVLGASFNSPGGIVRHDAVVWGYASAAQRLGVDVHQGVEVTGVQVEGGRCVGVETTHGRVSAGAVVCATAGNSTIVADMAGVRLPISTHPLQAFVTEPYKPMIDPVIFSSELLSYVSQSARGEFVAGGEIDRYTSYSSRSTFPFLAELSAALIVLFPWMAKVRILRQWTGSCDMTPDYSPIMGQTGVEGFYITGGWGTGGFKTIPIGGLTMAELVATGEVPELIAPYTLTRFRADRAVSERASAGTH